MKLRSTIAALHAALLAILLAVSPAGAGSMTLLGAGKAGGGGGSSPSYVLRTATGLNAFPSGTAATFSGVNLGTGTAFVLVSIKIQNDVPISSVTVGAGLTSLGTALTHDAGQGMSFYGASVSGLTGSDTITINTSSAIGSGDVNVVAWTLTNLAAPSSPVIASAASTTVAAAASVGQLVFVAGANGTTAANYSGSAQAPANTVSIVGGSGGQTLDTADWTAASGGISGGNFTATASTLVQLQMVIFH